MRGRKPIPTHLKLLRGNPGRRPIESEPEPRLGPSVPEPPPFLDGYAAEEWRKVAAELHCMKLLSVVDEGTLGIYCAAYQCWRNAQELLAEIRKTDPMRGLLTEGLKGNVFEHPLLAVSRRAAQEMLRVATEFGFAPAARARIASGVGHAESDSKFGDLLAR
jgi:P27 family predicted phage terminase small subunit